MNKSSAMIKTLRNLFRLISNGGYGYSTENVRKAFPDGHFYSPIPSLPEIKEYESRIWCDSADTLGIDFNDPEHRRWLTELLPRHLPYYDYPDSRPPGFPADYYFTQNPTFSWLDSRMLFSVLRELRPNRLIEVGSGFSSLLSADVNRRFLNGHLELVCIDPYPQDFLTAGVDGISRVIESKVQDVPMEMFDALGTGDILFIDSSHVAKTGSDVNFLYLKVLPRLRAGVLVHIHDIFFPNDYPKDWVLERGYNWNEQYLVQALLMFSNRFEVMFGCAYAMAVFVNIVVRFFMRPERPPGLGFGHVPSVG
jgi:hypothetical protein